MNRVVACVPAYNEAASIASVLIRAKPLVNDVIVCDDGSEDDTGEISRQLGAIVVKHERRLGYGSALRTLFTAALERGAEIVVTLDGDGQHDPAYIPEVVRPIVEGDADMVVGSRFVGDGKMSMPAYRRLGVKAISAMTQKQLRTRVLDAQSGFRAYNRAAIHSCLPAEMGLGASVEILMKADQQGLRIVEVPIKIRYGGLKDRKQNPITHAMGVIASYLKFVSLRHPLQTYGIPGGVSFALGLAFGVWTVLDYTQGHRLNLSLTIISVWLSLTGLLSIYTGIMLFTLVSIVREAKSKGEQ